MNVLHHHNQCPKCVLKFRSRSEMQWHLREDHPVPRTSSSSPLTIPVSRPEPAPPRDAAPRGFWARLWPGRRSS